MPSTPLTPRSRAARINAGRARFDALKRARIARMRDAAHEAEDVSTMVAAASGDESSGGAGDTLPRRGAASKNARTRIRKRRGERGTLHPSLPVCKRPRLDGKAVGVESWIKRSRGPISNV